MNIANLEAFVYVVHFGSFNKAAEALYLSQPSVTSRIRSLENGLNTTLFHRNGRHITLTESGKKLLTYAEKILQTYEEANYRLKQNISVQEQIRIGCSISISNYVLPEILPALIAHFPGLKLKILSHHTEDVLAKIANQEVDFGLVRTSNYPGMIHIPLFSYPIAVYAAPDHPLAMTHEQVPIHELVRHSIVFYDHNSVEWLLINRIFESVGTHPEVILEVDNMETTKRLVMKGMGICFLPEHSVNRELQFGLLVRIPLETELDIYTKVSLMYLKEREDSPVLNFLLDQYKLK